MFRANLQHLVWSTRYPGPRGFSFFSDERAAKQARVAERQERKTSGYLGLESHFHADARVRIWPSGSDWLIFLQTRKSIWLVCLIGKHVIADLPLVRFVIKNLTRLTAGVCMKVRFKSKVTRGFFFSPLRDSCSPLRGSLIGKKKKNLWDEGKHSAAILLFLCVTPIWRPEIASGTYFGYPGNRLSALVCTEQTSKIP